MSFQVELVWNREFHFVPHGPDHKDIDAAIRYAKDMEESGDGERVKKTKVVDGDGNAVWDYGKKL